MKNIYEILKNFGLEIPEDKKEEFDKAVNENYKTIKEVENINKKLNEAETERDTYKTKYDTDIATRDADLVDLKKKLEDAGVDKTKLDELTTQLGTLQTTYDNAKTDYEKKLAQQKKEFLIKESVNELKFSSNSAKKAFLADIIAKDLPIENDKILGFEDFVNGYKETDASAFISEKEDNDGGTGAKRFSGKSGSAGNEGGEGSPKNENPVIW